MSRWRTSRFMGGAGAGVGLNQCFDSVLLDCANKDWRLRRTAVSEATVDDGAGGPATLSVPGAGADSEQFGSGASTGIDNNNTALGQGAAVTRTSLVTVVNFALGALDTITLTQPSGVTVLTEGTDFVAAVDNDTTAESIRVAIDALAGLTATRVGAVVTIFGDLSALVTSDATAWTTTLGNTAGGTAVGQGALVTGATSLAVGMLASADADSTSLGADSGAGLRGVAVGHLALATGSMNAVAVGDQTVA
ncbi:hypothetical protein LCGC14_2995310, partial [marine sediment metagenome]